MTRSALYPAFDSHMGSTVVAESAQTQPADRDAMWLQAVALQLVLDRALLGGYSR